MTCGSAGDGGIGIGNAIRYVVVGVAVVVAVVC